MSQVSFSKIIGDSGIFIDGDWVESKDQDVNGDVRLIQLADIGDGYFIDKSKRFLTSQKAKELKCTYLKPGDLLIARMPEPLGRACLFPELEMPCITVVDVCILRPDSNIANVNWLKFSVNSPDFRNKIKQYIKGTTRQRISRGNLEKIQFNLPSLPDQLHIAKILSKAENLLAQRKESIRLLDEFLKSTFLEMFGDPVRNEKGWLKHPCNKILEVRGRVGWKGYKKTDLRQSGPYVLGATHLTDSGELNLSNLVHISMDKYIESPEIVVRKGDLLIVQRGNTVGKVGLVKEEIGEATINPCILILRPIMVNYFYLKYYFLQDKIQETLWKMNTGSAQPMITQGQLRAFEILFPPLKLQAQFAQIVEKIEALKTQYEQSLQELENLNDSLSQRAFRGELSIYNSKGKEIVLKMPISVS